MVFFVFLIRALKVRITKEICLKKKLTPQSTSLVCNARSLLLAVLCIFGFFPLHGQVLEYNTLIKIEKNQKHTERSFLIQINKRDENWLSEVGIRYSKDDDFDLIEACIVDTEGVVLRKLKKKEVITKSSISRGSFYEDGMEIEFTLAWGKYPYRIRYSYRKIEKEFLYLVNWAPLVFKNTFTKEANLRIETPIGYEISMDYPQHLVPFSSQQNGINFLQWQIKDYMPPSTESFSPPFAEHIPSIKVLPKTFNYGVSGNTMSWSSIGLWHANLIKDANDLPVSEKVKVHELIKGVSEPTKKVEILYEYLQDNTRYINIAIDVGGLKPYPADYVCANRYGDCKALTVYMKALLEEAEIPSFYTLVCSGANAPRLDTGFPGQPFNHVMLCVPVVGDTLWLENTSQLYPMNYVGVSTQNRWALLVNWHDSKLIRTPALDLEDVREEKVYHFELNEEGSGKASVKLRLRGRAFERYCYINKEMNKADQADILLQDLNIAHIHLDDWEFHRANRQDKTISISLDLECTEQIRSVSSLKVIKPIPISIPDLETPSLRKNSVRINFPINQIDSTRYSLPFIGNYEIEIPEKTRIESAYGFYEEIYEKGKNKILHSKHFVLYAADYSIEEYENLYSFISSIKKIQSNSTIILKIKQ